MSDLSKLEQYLESFKAGEEANVHTAIILADDREAQRVLSTWSMLPISWEEPKGEAPEDLRDLWDWLWGGIKVNWALLGERTGMTAARVQNRFEPLRANRLVYPDGTVSGNAIGFLKSEVLKTMQKGKSKSKNKED